MFKNYSLLFKWYPPLEKVSQLPSHTKRLVFFDRGDIIALIVTQLIVGVFSFFVLFGTFFGDLEVPVLVLIFFVFVLAASWCVVFGEVYRLVTKKMTALARDDDWLYLDELDPKRVRIQDIQEVVIFKTGVNFRVTNTLYFRMKDGRSIGRTDLQWWPMEKVIELLEQQDISVVRK
jgi:hypothetical protein